MSDFIAVIGNVRRIRCICGAIPDLSHSGSHTKSETFPQADVTIREGVAHIYADLPGVDPDDISIYVYGSMVVIEGMKSRPPNNKGGYKYLRLERHFAAFKRIFKLPFDVVRYEAVIHDGVLHVALAAD